MAMWSEELRRLTLFDGEAELTPESRPVWQQNMELRTKFVRYPGPKPDGLHPTHFWFLEHYGLLPYFLQMQAEGIPAKAPREPAGIPLQIINDYLLCKAGSGPTPSRRYNLPVVSAFLRLTYYRLVNWAHMLAGGLASAVKEYVRKFSGGPGEAVVMVSWAPALMKIIKHNRALLFDSPLNCPEPWEVYTDCFGSYEQADVLQGVHSRRAVAKDALPRILRLRPEERIENASQQAPAQPQPRKRRAPTSSSAPARETQTATRPTRITETTAEPEGGKYPSIRGQTVSAPEPPRRLQTGGRQALNGSRQKAIEQIPLPPPGQKKKKNKTPAVQPGPERNSSAQPPAREQRVASATVEEERPDIGPRYTDEEVRRLHPELFVQLRPAPPTAGVPQPIPVGKTLLDRLAEISRPEAMSGTAEEDQAIRDMVRDL
ncbi:hypothetical protein R1flu_024532 [Riccia fluitans]|uniref:Aminotransferase-like plant mobile domain-containing protein n=1 Tax=Riccia fluitans TaxID=41844 RepID=A0ABD1XV63_9MARC